MAVPWSDDNFRPLVLRQGVEWDPKARRAFGTGTPESAAADRRTFEATAPNQPWQAAPNPQAGAVANPDNTATPAVSAKVTPKQDTPTPLAVPQWNMPDSVQRALAEKGLLAAPVDQSPNTPKELMDMGNIKALKAYDYSMSDSEWNSLQQLYGKQTGEKAAAPVIKGGEIEAAPMTQKAYAALTSEQKSAVDFNTLLVDAREKDLTTKTTLTGDALKEYTDSIDSMFGPNGGSATVAPNVAKLLQSVKYTGKGQDLDQFLSLDAAVTADQLKDFKLPPMPVIKPSEPTVRANEEGGVPSLNDPVTGKPKPVRTAAEDFTQVRSADNEALARGLAIRNTAAFIDAAMKNVANRTNDPLSAARSQLGTPDKLKIGWNTTQVTPGLSKQEQYKDTNFAGAYDYLKNPANADLNVFWQKVQAADFSEKEIDELFNYIDEFSAYEKRTGVTHEGMRSPDEIRKFAGLGGK